MRDGGVHREDVLVRGNEIERVGESLSAPAERRLDVSGCYVCPGFVDLHVHGGGGHDFNEASNDAARSIVSTHLRHGTTALLGGVLTDSIPRMRSSMETLHHARLPGLMGIYLEGPFFSPEQKGAQPEQHLLQPSTGRFDRLVEGLEEAIRVVVLAPELPGGVDLIPRVRSIGAIPSLGHSDARYEEARSFERLGGGLYTHFFNGMRGFHHRQPGTVGAGLDGDAPLELIADGVHVDPAAVRLLQRCAGPSRICLVTDAMAAAGMGDGEYRLGPRTVRVEGGEARLADSGSLASSVLTMDRAVRNMVRFGASIPDAVRSASGVPARVLGEEDRIGSVHAGKRADLVVMDRDLRVQHVIQNGTLIED